MTLTFVPVDQVKPGQIFHSGGVDHVALTRDPDGRLGIVISDLAATEREMGGWLQGGDPMQDLMDAAVYKRDPEARAELMTRDDWRNFARRYIRTRHNWTRNKTLARLDRRRASQGPATVVTDAFSGRPCLIVGNGPSLAKNAALLETVDTSRAVVIYTNRVPQGARTDGAYYACVDHLGRDRSGRSFVEGLDTRSMTALLDCRVAWHVADAPWRARMWLRASYRGDRLVAEIKRALPWVTPTVEWHLSLTRLLHAAFLWGCRPIVLVGQDLALGEEPEMHPGEPIDFSEEDEASCFFRLHPSMARFASEAGAPLPQSRFLIEQDIAGRPTWTTTDFYQAAVHVQGQMELQTALSRIHVRRRPRFINATEGGILRRGCEHMTLAAVLEEYELKGQRHAAA
ncbi:MAG TPA: hypothetical protein VMY87_06275 [Armatimonadota bacterium]|nr:hypothetical protein [Armatimonadota bacterium]